MSDLNAYCRHILNCIASILNYKGSWLEWTEREGKGKAA